MSLKATLEEIKQGFESKAPQDALEIMHRATADLKNSGIMNQVPKVGDTIGDFTRPNQNGVEISLRGALENNRAVALSFYRGRW